MIVQFRISIALVSTATVEVEIERTTSKNTNYSFFCEPTSVVVVVSLHECHGHRIVSVQRTLVSVAVVHWVPHISHFLPSGSVDIFAPFGQFPVDTDKGSMSRHIFTKISQPADHSLVILKVIPMEVCHLVLEIKAWLWATGCWFMMHTIKTNWERRKESEQAREVEERLVRNRHGKMVLLQAAKSGEKLFYAFFH